MMRSSESGFIRNPTLAAMVGSAVVHCILVMVAILNPADSKTSNPLRIISLTPPAQNPGFIKPGSTLQVPNVQPPVNLGNAPGASQIPNISQFKAAPSSSVYLGGTNFPSISMRNLQTKNIPQPSIQNPGLPIFGNFGSPTAGNPGGTVPPGFNSPTNAVPNGSSSEGSQPDRFESSPKATTSQPDYRGYAVAKNPDLPAVASENFRNSDPANFPYAQLSPPPSPPSSFGGIPTPPPQTTATALPPLNREELKTFGAKMSKRFNQALSSQKGASLTAAYPKEACASQKGDSAIITGVFGPDGSLAGADTITIARSASNMVFNQAAIAAVQNYRAPAAPVYQMFNFTVDIPYSAAVCKAANPEPSPNPTQSPTPSSSPSIQPPIGPSPKPNSIDQPSQPIQPSQPKTPDPPVQPPELPAPLPAPSLQPEPAPEPAATDPTPTPSSAPSETPSAPEPSASEPSAIAEPSNDTSESSPMEPLPTPSVSVPEEAKP